MRNNHVMDYDDSILMYYGDMGENVLNDGFYQAGIK